jgi:hypothetical protein
VATADIFLPFPLAAGSVILLFFLSGDGRGTQIQTPGCTMSSKEGVFHLHSGLSE